MPVLMYVFSILGSAGFSVNKHAVSRIKRHEIRIFVVCMKKSRPSAEDMVLPNAIG